VLAGLALMTLGGVLMGLAPNWNTLAAGRLLAGLGGVTLNVLMAKMVTDWFAGREIATAMGIYVNSWPFGIAIALLALPAIGAGFGPHGACIVAAAAAALAFLLLLSGYRAPPDLRQSAGAPGSGAPRGRAAAAIILAGLVWGLFNGALSMVFSFGNSLLTETGWSLGAAGSATSLVLWLAVLSVPTGGVLADRSGRPGLVLIGGCLLFALALGIAARTTAVWPAFVALGLVCGLPAGAIMSLPARVLTAGNRAVGMGVFWTMFYLVTVASPWIGGQVAAASGSVVAAFDLGAALLVLACLCYLAFTRVVARPVG